MKKYLPYLLAALAFLVLGTQIILSLANRPRKFVQRVSLRQKDKIPYGTYVARQLLPVLFPNAVIRDEHTTPGEWMDTQKKKAGQAVILPAKYFNADDYEMNQVYEFVKEGNYVFILAHSLSFEANNLLGTNLSFSSFETFYGTQPDSLRIYLEHPPFSRPHTYVYPGRRYESSFRGTDTLRTVVLGRNDLRETNFIRMNAGKGSVFIHLAPVAFSNYFLLHKDNARFLEQAFSVIPPEIHTVVWNEYYLLKPHVQQEKNPGLYRVLLQYPSFRWGLFTAVFALLLYVLLHLRRRQRLIPELAPPKNESLDFVKTMGRLYYDQGDHANLGRKMAVYFLEHLRSQYKVATHTLDTTFVESIHTKTEYPFADLKSIIDFIQFLETAPALSEQQLAQFHQQLENFYHTTQKAGHFAG